MNGVARVARPAVLRRLPLDRHAIIEASAGTGKTFTLENIVVELLLATDVPLDRLLVVTFTEKATHEIRARVRARLEELRTGKGTPPTDEETRAGDYWTIDTRAREKLEHALRAFDGATIATIHAFCFSVLRENAFASGRLFQERQVDGRESFGRAFRDALRRDVARDPARAPWLEAALRAGTSIDGIEDLLWRCLSAHGDPRPRFDVAELARAVSAFPVDDARDTRIEAELAAQRVNPARSKTIVRDVRALAALVGRMRGTTDWPSFIHQASDIELGDLVERLGHVDLQRPSRAQPVLTAALALAQRTPSFQAALVQATFGPVHEEFLRAKRVAGQYDFDDMLALVDDALRGPRGVAIAEAMRRRWRYALVDEFQDTDETQWSIFRRAFFEPRPGPASVAVFVGDPKQSIYRFRGADVQTYLGARDAVAAAGGTRLSLDRNFRATSGLVDAMNHLFEETTNGGALLTGSNEYQPVQCGRPGRALVDGDGRAVAPVGVLRFQDEATGPALGRRIAAEIARITDPVRPWRLDGRALEPSDVFVLTRTEREGRAVGECFRAAGVPHAFYRQEGLFQCAEADDVRALLAAIADPHDRAARLRAWLTPFFGLPLASIEGARDLPAAHPLVARLHEWKALADARRFDRLFESILRETGVIRREIFFADGERSLTNTLHLLEVLLEQSRDGHPALLDLVNGLSRLIDETRTPLDVYEGNVQRIESERRAVQIMTMHKAKGLEAAVVFVAGGLWKGRGESSVRVYHEEGRRLAWVGPVPKGMSGRIKDEENEENERLMYVALTRAIGRLVLPCVVDSRGDAKGKRRAGQATNLAGPFDEVNRKLVELVAAGDPLFEVDEVAASAGAVVSEPPAPAAWQPPAELLRDDDARARYGKLRERAAGAIVTSYTRLRGERTGPRPARERMDDQRSDKGMQALDDGALVPLRGARGSGVFLHEILERVPTATFSAADLDAWRAAREVAALFDEAATVHRIDPAQRPHAEEMVWRAFTSPVALPGEGGRLEGLWRARRVVREMDFVFPIPGREDVGYVRGSLDLAFEHEGLTYFVDWKSDTLASYAPEALERHVTAHYADQVTLYTLAVGKLLGVRSAHEHAQRFGGIVYCFLRGVDGSGGGNWTSRPTWDDVAASETALRKRDWTAPRRSP